ncbi:adenosine 3'-phospho 5'-phosphosulfate transporter 2 [Arctopsyche grandis]|uniref:adenosine 3'-phospho 5'-phosphosulfate transporter 2 n=1 Tax=Arctopsyche grandis TaxID=121162 RepID=UPI00406D9E61
MDSKVLIQQNDDSRLQTDNEQKLKLLCFDLNKFSPLSRFLLCCLTVFIFFLAYGYFQELIFTLEGFKPYGWYLTQIQFLYYTIFGWIEMKLKKIEQRRIPMRTYIILAFLTLGTMGFSNSSLGYLNYPTQVIFKCCKLVPVLIGSVLIQGKKYGILDYLAAITMCIGLTFFILADSKTSPNFNTVGVIMISLALLCDAMIGNIQEKAMKSFQATNTEVVLYSYSIGFVYLSIIMILTGQFTKGFNFCIKHPVETYGYGLLFSFTGYMGIQAVLILVKTCGAPTAATVTTARKAVTMVFSFILFSKPFVFQYLWSGIIVLFGIYLNVYSKKYPNFNIYSMANIFKRQTQAKHFSAIV